MVKLLIQRKWSVRDATIGELFLNDEFFCFTLEDIVRPENQKVFGETAIPTGTYRVVVDWSEHFQRNMPHILDVHGFEGVRIHSGNKPADTEGCVLVGDTHDLSAGTIGESRMAYERLFRKLDAEKDIILTIREV